MSTVVERSRCHENRLERAWQEAAVTASSSQALKSLSELHDCMMSVSCLSVLCSSRGYRSDLAASLGLRYDCRDFDFAHLPRREWGAAFERHAVRNNPTRWAGRHGSQG